MADTVNINTYYVLVRESNQAYNRVELISAKNKWWQYIYMPLAVWASA